MIVKSTRIIELDPIIHEIWGRNYKAEEISGIYRFVRQLICKTLSINIDIGAAETKREREEEKRDRGRGKEEVSGKRRKRGIGVADDGCYDCFEWLA